MFSSKLVFLSAALLAFSGHARAGIVAAPVAAPLAAVPAPLAAVPAPVAAYARAVPYNVPPFASAVNIQTRALAAPFVAAAPVAAYAAAPVAAHVAAPVAAYAAAPAALSVHPY